MNQIRNWCESLGLPQYAAALERQEVDLAALVLLTDADLRDMGIPLGPRRKMLAAIGRFEADGADAAAALVSAPERRQLTILFCDLVGSTEYADRMDPEDFRHLLQTYLDTCADVLERHDGFVAAYVGDAVKAYFGYPAANEDDAERALTAALSILRAVPRIPVPGGRPLAVRIGVATGVVVISSVVSQPAGMSTLAFGHVAHLAARLQTAARPQSVLTEPETHRAAAGALRFASAGEHALKGFAEPVPVWEVRGTRKLESRFAKRQRLSPLIGRARELDLLLERWGDTVATGSGSAALICGEPGIGKSRLVHELRSRVGRHTRFTLQCSPYFSNTPLYPVLTELKRRAEIGEGDTGTEKRRKLESALRASAVPWSTSLPLFARLLSIPLPDRVAEPDGDAARQREITRRVLLDWMAARARVAPLMITVEDEQWMDSSSRELLVQIASRMDGMPAMIVVTSREDSLVGLAGAEVIATLRLDRLGRAETEELVRSLGGGRHLPAQTIAHVLDKAEGVPLFVEELTTGAIDAATAPGAAGGTRHGEQRRGVDIPSSLQSSLLARLDRLGDAKEIAQVAATIGREFEADLLRDVCDLPPRALDVALGRLVESGLITTLPDTTGGLYTFRHALLQDAAKDTLLHERRQELHGVIADTLQAGYPASCAAHPELLAHHLTEAHRFEGAAASWYEAASKAAETWAKLDAARLYANALACLRKLPATEERRRMELRVLLGRGDVLYATFGYVTGEGSQAYHDALALSDEVDAPEAAVRALDGLFGTHFNSAHFRDAEAVSDRLIAIGERRDALKALVIGLQFKGMSLFCQGRLEQARDYLERALGYRQRWREVGSDFPSMAMLYLSWTMHVLGAQTRALELFESAEKLVRTQAAYRLAACLGNGCVLFAFREDAATIRRLTDELLPLAREHGFNFWMNMGTFFRGWVMAHEQGDAAGVELMQSTYDTLGDQEIEKSCYLGLLARAYQRSGQLERAVATVETALAQVARTGENYYTAELLRLRGELCALATGDTQRAREHVRQALDFARTQRAGTWERRALQTLRTLDVEDGAVSGAAPARDPRDAARRGLH